MRSVIAVLLALIFIMPAVAQDSRPGEAVSIKNTGSADLENILARQRGEVVDIPRTRETGDPGSAAAIAGQLGAGATDEEVFRAIRLGTDDVKVSTSAPAAGVLIQTGGMRWLELREGPLRLWGGILLIAMIIIIAAFFLWRGRVRIEGGRSGRTLLRFTFIERFAHWMLGGSFILLAISGLIVLFGRHGLIELIGHEAYAALAVPSKWVHNNVAWAFMVALVLAFVFWIWHNIPNRTDLVWIRQGGGLFDKSRHPPAKKFNAGQKVVFWGTIILGASVSASGLSLLFPYELPMFAKTFGWMNATGIPDLFGSPLTTDLAPQEEQQLAQLWHAIVSFLMMALVLGHIYLGSLGMEGAFDAMGTGKVDYNWAKEHHSLWVEEVEEREGRRGSPPREGAPAPAE